jgi:hypothetical protein
MMAKCILFESSAVEIVLKYLKDNHGYSWSGLLPINKGRYYIVHGKEGHDSIAVILKKAWLDSYSNLGFIDEMSGKAETGLGDSINVDDLREMCKNNVNYIYVCYQDGKIYKISFADFIEFSHKWINKESKELRSISIHRYERVNK